MLPKDLAKFLQTLYMRDGREFELQPKVNQTGLHLIFFIILHEAQ